MEPIPTLGNHLYLKASLEYVQAGETLVVTRLDRHARSTLHLAQWMVRPDRR